MSEKEQKTRKLRILRQFWPEVSLVVVILVIVAFQAMGGGVWTKCGHIGPTGNPTWWDVFWNDGGPMTNPSLWWDGMGDTFIYLGKWPLVFYVIARLGLFIQMIIRRVHNKAVEPAS